MYKFLAALILVLYNPSKSAAAFGIGASAVSAAMGFDPYPWVIGAAGAAIVLVKTQHISKRDDVINSLISVCLAGLVAPWWAEELSQYFSQKPTTTTAIYGLAFILSAAWPALIKLGLPFVKKRLEG